MALELGILNDGGVMMVSDQPLPDLVKRVEYYREQRLFLLVYNNSDQHDDEMLEYEIPADMSKPVESAPNVIIYSLYPDHEPIGYKAPLIKIGNYVQAA